MIPSYHSAPTNALPPTPDHGVTFRPDVDAARQAAILKAYRAVTGRVRAFRPDPPTPSTRPAAGGARDIGTIARDYGQLAAKADDTAGRIARAAGRQLIPGWHVRATDGHFALLTPARETDDRARAAMYPAPVSLPALPVEAWAAYARVRTCRRKSSGAVTWAWGGGCLTLTASDPENGCEASEWLPLADGAAVFPPVAIMLADEYAYPLRGRAWDVAQSGGAGGVLIFTAAAEQTAIAIMPMKF